MRLVSLLFFVITLLVGCKNTDVNKEPVDWVNPFVGTDFAGHTFPGASLPYSMVHLSPDVGVNNRIYSAGYLYSIKSILGFSHAHWSGTGLIEGGEILFMPNVGDELHLTPGSIENPDEGYRSRFDHENESASPGYYSVLLKDYNINVELTSTKRVGFHRYTFPKADNSKVILDLGHQIGELSPDEISHLKIIDNNRIEGAKGAGTGKLYFVAEFSKPFVNYGTFDATGLTPKERGRLYAYKGEEKGADIGAIVYFKTSKNEQILLKVGISYTSVEGARKNLESEIPHWNFDRVKNDARKIWSDELSRIKIEGATDDQKEIFYTAMYHTLLAQYINQDVDGKYFGSDGKVHIAKDYDFYGSFSAWDTYRSQHPLLTLTAPDHVNDFMKSIVAKTKNYGWLPAQHFLNIFGEAMVGDHLIPIIVDAYRKGYQDYDVQFLYEAMRKKALENPTGSVPSYAGRSGLDYYKKLGYAPADKITESVPNTLELAYDDWCIAQLAKELGKDEDYHLFMKRAHNFQNLWDSETQFMRPKNLDGSWLEAINGGKQGIVREGDHSYFKYFDPLHIGYRPNRHYTESNAWQYLWSVQHDVQGLINLFGGEDEFASKLDTFFEMSTIITPPKYGGYIGTIGQYAHGNQPSHHVAYLYNYAGQPWKTQQRVRQVTEQLYTSGPGGLCGNDDMGSLSSWYMLSAMGFYPVTPGSTSYAIGSPLFGITTIAVGNDKTFTIETFNNSRENMYIQSATLNGKPMNRTWITHQEITNGGALTFQMGPEPNKKWGISNGSTPPSMSKK